MTIANDNKLTNSDFQDKWGKTGHHTNESGGVLTKIKILIEVMAFNAKFKLITMHKNQHHAFNSDAIRYLMKSCDEEARRVLQNIIIRKMKSNIVNFGKWSISFNYRVMEGLVREDVIIIDAMASESNYLFDRHPQNPSIIDREARKLFSK